MTQDDIVTDFIEHTTDEAASLTGLVLVYQSQLSTLLFQLPGLDTSHRDQVRNGDKSQLIQLRSRLEALLITLQYATRAPDV